MTIHVDTEKPQFGSDWKFDENFRERDYFRGEEGYGGIADSMWRTVVSFLNGCIPEEARTKLALVKYMPLPISKDGKVSRGESCRPAKFFISPLQHPKCKDCGYKDIPGHFKMAPTAMNDLACPKCGSVSILWRFGSYVHNTYRGSEEARQVEVTSALLALLERHPRKEDSVNKAVREAFIGYEIMEINDLDGLNSMVLALSIALPEWQERPIIHTAYLRKYAELGEAVLAPYEPANIALTMLEDGRLPFSVVGTVLGYLPEEQWTPELRRAVTTKLAHEPDLIIEPMLKAVGDDPEARDFAYRLREVLQMVGKAQDEGELPR